MASITIRNLDEALKARLRIQAAIHSRSMEDEARDILRSALSLHAQPTHNLAKAIHARFAGIDGFDMPEIQREPIREAPVLGE